MITLRVAVLSGTGLLVAALGAWPAVVRWEDGDRTATSVSALAAVAAVGVSVRAALHASREQPTLVASRTGSATTRRGDANGTGWRLYVPAPGRTAQPAGRSPTWTTTVTVSWRPRGGRP
ncbi:hypothetical protein ABZ177_15090 [Streptomyces sp. NPDC006284]|uniref:hypothetical protein n=1 Tax=unclassified Streptomyces TaxID=2593676 RepID=UPI0033A42A25